MALSSEAHVVAEFVRIPATERARRLNSHEFSYEANAPRRGFTLIELMVVMLIISILAAAMGYVMITATESAKIAATRNTIAKIHTLLMQRYESYRFRRLPIQMPPGVSPKIAAQIRCDTLRQLMRMEMPDRWSDIIDGPANIQNLTVAMLRPSVSTSYLATYTNLTSNSNFTAHQYDCQSAQCLYMIVTMGLEDNDTLENFSQSEIADPNGTGAKYFVDAWGNPIKFLRWAPGFVSPLQVSMATNDPRLSTLFDQTDPTGVYGTPPTTYALYPLIYSAGPDGFYDIVEDAYVTPLTTATAFHYSSTTPPNNPFATLSNSSFPNKNSANPDGSIGRPQISAADAATGRTALGNSDDITNHAIGYR